MTPRSIASYRVAARLPHTVPDPVRRVLGWREVRVRPDGAPSPARGSETAGRSVLPWQRAAAPAPQVGDR